MYTLPHSIRVDPHGDVWTVDAASSDVVKYSVRGRVLMTIHVGGQPDNGSLFHGATDVAFGRHGNVYVADGYGNDRVLEYAANGKLLRQWGTPGSGRGEFNLPHAIEVAADGTVYVADRENGRIQRFDPDGRFLGQTDHLGRVYCFQVSGPVIWATMGPFDQPPGSGGWLVKIALGSGKILGHVDMPEDRSGHAMAIAPSGEPVVTSGVGLLWFKADR